MYALFQSHSSRPRGGHNQVCQSQFSFCVCIYMYICLTIPVKSTEFLISQHPNSVWGINFDLLLFALFFLVKSWHHVGNIVVRCFLELLMIFTLLVTLTMTLKNNYDEVSLGSKS